MLTATNDIEVLRKRLALLEEVVTETIWMARRYAHGSRTFAPTTVNESIDTCLAMGIKITEDRVDSILMYAKDGGLGEWLPNKGKFQDE